MKKFKLCITISVCLIMFFSSCSKDEQSGVIDSSNLASISFSTLLKDFEATRAALKQGVTGDVPECSETIPTKVRVALKNSLGAWVAGRDGDLGNYIEISIISDGDGWITNEVEELEFPEDTYTLEYFAVLDANDTTLWIAPRSNDVYGPSNFAAFVSSPLPIEIDLRAGVKKYVDVEVLCYDQRMADEYGYLFFDFTTVETITLCVFGNYCNEEVIHFPARFSLEAWTFSGEPNDPKGFALTNGALINSTGFYDTPTEAYAKPLCIALPDRTGIDTYYIEITILDFDGAYDAPEGLKQSFTIIDAEVLELYNDNGNSSYYHFREGCEDEPCADNDSDCDGIEDEIDNCPNTYNPAQLDSDADGIGDACDACPDVDDNLDQDSDGVPDCKDECKTVPGPESNNGCPITNGDSCNTAWMFGDHTWIKKDDDGLNVSAKWGWAELFSVQTQNNTSFNIYAGAGNNKIGPEKLVGTAVISAEGSNIIISVESSGGIDLKLIHIYTSDNMPVTDAPGQFDKLPDSDGIIDQDPSSVDPNIYNFKYSGDGEFWVAVHADVCAQQ